MPDETSFDRFAFNISTKFVNAISSGERDKETNAREINFRNRVACFARDHNELISPRMFLQQVAVKFVSQFQAEASC